MRKKEIGTKHQRKLQKYSTNFNEIFTFFLNSYRKGLLTFCGSDVDVKFDIDGPEGKNTFRMFDNGYYKGGKEITSCHPNIVRAVIIGKKSWGLWLNEWADGIAEGSFTKYEILEEFEKNGIKIPESLYKDFCNRIVNKVLQKNQKIF